MKGGKQRLAYEIKRPKKDKKLPVVLSRGVSQILSAHKRSEGKEGQVYHSFRCSNRNF